MKNKWNNIIFNFFFIISSLIIVLIFFKNILLTNALLFTITIIGLLKWKSKLSLIIFVTFGLLFGIGEIIVSSLGPWKYAITSTLTIPSWLFILWGNSALFIHQTIREIRKSGIKENKL
jgi:hypothetical protein